MRVILPRLSPTLFLILLNPWASPGAGDERFESVDARAVTVGGEIGRRIQVTVHTNMFALDVEKDFLEPFRATPRSGKYIGLGKLIDATARLAHHTDDPALVSLKKNLVGEAIAAQEPDGYLGTMLPEKRMWTLWDIHEMSYLVLALATDHRLFAEEGSLAASKKLAGYLIRRWETDPPKQPSPWNITLHMGVTGIENAMLALHAETGDAQYLDFVRATRRLPEWNAHIAIGRWGTVEGHAYAHLCRCLAQLRLDSIAPDPRLIGPSHDALEFILRGEGMTVTGEIGDHECWHDTQEGTVNLGETCASAYLLRWLDEMVRRDADLRLGDVMERALFNALFAAQSPDGRRIRYYTPFDGQRGYYEGDTYCCPNNYRRIIAELPGMIFYRSRDGVAVNQYTASTATMPLGGDARLEIRQETDYPASGAITIRVDPSRPTRFALRLRIPRWCAAPTAKVNGEDATIAKGQATLVIDRQWKAGDRVQMDFPMPWRLVRGRINQAGKVAIMRGPLVYCLNPKRHPKLAGMDLHLLVLKPDSITTAEGQRDFSGAPLCRANAWRPAAWYPSAKANLELNLAPFPDPDAESAYFKVPNPHDPATVEDELFGR
ncbi:MAG TPA: glycoside hydrolase family 127 protein [Verrucomicrobiae bacterium]|nr:glycoside hydrolase family 127 protein [Verrucomicrobiae bacterium]